MVVYADDRESASVLQSLIGRMGDADIENEGLVKVRRLTTGDYVLGSWGIEAKEINDFYRSITGKGRGKRSINHQLSDLCETYEYPILAVYGSRMKPYFRKKVAKRVVAQEIVKMQQTMRSYKMMIYHRFPKIRLIEFATMEEFVEWLSISHTQMQISNALSAPKKARRGRSGHSDPRIAALTGIAGVTESIAKDVLSHFGGIKPLLLTKTNRKALTAIRGVNTPIADRILSLREPYDE